MTTLDRAFIRAYSPRDAAAQSSAVAETPAAQAAYRVDPAHSLSPSSVGQPPVLQPISAEPTAAPPAVDHSPAAHDAAMLSGRPEAVAKRSSVLAALEQPFHSPIGLPLNHPAAVAAPTMPADEAVSAMPSAAASFIAPPLAEPPIAEPVAAPLPSVVAPAFSELQGPASFSSMETSSGFASPNRPLVGARPQPGMSAPTLSAFMRLREADAAATDDADPMADPMTEATAPSYAAATLPVEPPGALVNPGAISDPPVLSVYEEPPEWSTSQEPAPFRPAWQVEQFNWPRACRRLFTKAGIELDGLADALLAIHQEGSRILAVSGWHRGEGATTMLLCIAKRLAERGVRPLLIDADLERPRLAKRLGIQPQAGWEQALASSNPTSLDQIVVESTTNNIALAPALETSADGDPPTNNRSQLPECIASLQPYYDLTLVDLGPLEQADVRLDAASGGVLRGIDAVVLVRDERISSFEQIRDVQERLMANGVRVIGVIENFVEI